MKIIHTSDWHVGCTLDYYDRTYEHRCFFNFLTDTIRNENADALIVAGDIFDSANPTSDSQKFLNELTYFWQFVQFSFIVYIKF